MIHRTPRWPAAIVATLAALCLGLALSSPARADLGTSSDAGCTNGNFTGDTDQGTWHRTYNPGCDGVTTATIDVSWNNYTDGNGHHHIVWDAKITTGPIYANDCVYVALDWENPQGGHSDTQHLRNCYESSTYHPGVMPQNLDTRAWTGSSVWHLKRIQIGTYDPDTGDTRLVVCPNATGSPGSTNTDSECSSWLSNGAAAWDSKGAKIYRKTNTGAEQNNAPFYPEAYDIQAQMATAF